MFISFEGIAGSGKTTQVQLLAEYLRNNESPDILVSAAYEGVRRKTVTSFMKDVDIIDNQQAVLYIFQALHALQYKEVSEALTKGYTVVADRWRESFIVHHSVAGTFDGFPTLQDGLDMFTFGTLEPDICFYIDIPPALAYERYVQRELKISENGLKIQDMHYMELAAKHYGDIARQKGWILLDGKKTVSEIFETVLDSLHPMP